MHVLLLRMIIIIVSSFIESYNKLNVKSTRFNSSKNNNKINNNNLENLSNNNNNKLLISRLNRLKQPYALNYHHKFVNLTLIILHNNNNNNNNNKLEIIMIW